MSVWELHGSRELCLRSALAYVDCCVHRSRWRQLSTMVRLVTCFREISLGRFDRVDGVCPRLFVTSARKVKGQGSVHT